MSEMLDVATRRTVGVRDIPLVLVAPRRLFSRVEDVAAWGWPLLLLVTVVALIGYATVQTGLIDREVDRQVGKRIEQIDKVQRDVAVAFLLEKFLPNPPRSVTKSGSGTPWCAGLLLRRRRFWAVRAPRSRPDR